MAKYQPLMTFLASHTVDQLTMTFEEIGGLVGGLPPSAYQYREWWANHQGEPSQGRAWMSVGWRVASVDLQGERVTFARADAPSLRDSGAVGSFGRPGAASVEWAASRILDSGFRRDDSVVTPSLEVWSGLNASYLNSAFVDHPKLDGGTFVERLRIQLRDAPTQATQLAAELLLLNVLPLSDYYPATKRKLVNEVLSWCDPPLELPDEISRCLDFGVFRGGVAFKTLRWSQLSYLIQLVAHWKAMDPDERAGALADPWTFRTVIRTAPGPNAPAQRNALLYLFFPKTFLPIVKIEHRKAVRDAFVEYAAEPTGDLERDLAQIRDAIEEENAGPVDFYRQPWRERWDPSTQADEATGDAEEVEEDAVIRRRAWLLRASNSDGLDVVSTWLRDGGVHLPVADSRVAALPHRKAELQGIVDESYHHLSYSARREKVEELNRYLNVMRIGDLVVTTRGDEMYIGAVAGESVSVRRGRDGTSQLHRDVRWLNGRRPVANSDLPDPLPSRLGSQHALVDLTSDLALIEALVTASASAIVSAQRPVHLRSPTKEFADDCLVDRRWLDDCIELLRIKRQLVLYGPPGTGKTFLAQRLARYLAGRENVKLVQFHPAYSYEDFFEGFRPHASEDGKLGFDLRPGPFRKLVDRARDAPSRPHILIIDEINRANIAKVFGELYFLLEYRDEAIDLLYASDEVGFTLPKNVFIIGTMNTADRSIALFDTAMRRRFAFVALHPSEEPTAGMLARWLKRENQPELVARLLSVLNERIADPDFKIGPSYFMHASVHVNGGLERVWRTSIMPLLNEHHYGEQLDMEELYGLERLRSLIDGPA